MQGIQVRTECEDDFKAIDVVNLSAFEGEEEALLITSLRKLPGYTPEFSLVAEFNGRIVGHLMLTPSILAHRHGEHKILIIAPMSVVPSQSHRGIGTELVNEAIERGKQAGFEAMIVAGKPDYYARLGFIHSDKWKITSNLGVPADALLGIELVEGSLAKGGEVHYPDSILGLYRATG